MRAWIVSDLHLHGSQPWPLPVPEADLAIVAGDLGEGLLASIERLAAAVLPHMSVLFVAGNHEFYGGAVLDQIQEGRALARARGLHFLENETARFGRLTVSGATLWTDYRADGADRQRASMEAARVGMRDHRRIALTREPAWRRFRPEDALDLHVGSLAFLEAALADAPSTPEHPHVVVTHHAPSPQSIGSAFTNDPLNAAFVSDLTDTIRRTSPAAWVHGHVHENKDYRIEDTRVVCNPKGYGRENADFDPSLVVEFGA